MCGGGWWWWPRALYCNLLGLGVGVLSISIPISNPSPQAQSQSLDNEVTTFLLLINHSIIKHDTCL